MVPAGLADGQLDREVGKGSFECTQRRRDNFGARAWFAKRYSTLDAGLKRLAAFRRGRQGSGPACFN